MPINPKIKFIKDVLDVDKLEQVPTRNGYGKGLVEAGEKDKNVVALCADLTESTRTHWFKEKFPERFIEIGVAEQNLASVASGLAAVGKIPFISSYATFSPGRNWEQIRTTISYNDRPVKIVGSHAGVSVGPDGATHQATEDIAITRVMANMTVLVPCDAAEAHKATVVAAKINGPVYIRLARADTPIFTTKLSPFKPGKAEIFWDVPKGKKADVLIIGCGSLIYNALLAADKLEKEGIFARVINNHTIKPIDENVIIKEAKDCGAVVTVEEHTVVGGMGSAVAEVLAKNYPVPQEFIGVQDRFGESGAPEDLIEKLGMAPKHIIQAVKKVIKRKNN